MPRRRFAARCFCEALGLDPTSLDAVWEPAAPGEVRCVPNERPHPHGVFGLPLARALATVRGAIFPPSEVILDSIAVETLDVQRS